MDGDKAATRTGGALPNPATESGLYAQADRVEPHNERCTSHPQLHPRNRYCRHLEATWRRTAGSLDGVSVQGHGCCREAGVSGRCEWKCSAKLARKGELSFYQSQTALLRVDESRQWNGVDFNT